MKIDIGIQAILMFCFRNMRGCNVDITDGVGGFMNYAHEMGSGTIIYVPSFVRIGSEIQKLMGEGDT
jgi:hypothetical protein